MKIREVIVVEGKDDTTAVLRAVKADTIETNGSAISPSTIEMIRRAQKTRGAIIFTDPDYPGEKIRKTIAEEVSGCKHAFIEKEQGLPKHGRGVGVEHASAETIRQALKDAVMMNETARECITFDDLVTAGLIAGPGAKERREKLGKLLKIGYTNGKQLHKRLMMFEISETEFAAAVETVRREDTHA
ncbi:ribonuclease M5 [Mesobacillus zeae]|uniref:Ribonuclease M5 n=1 Tax=Mesobacillus zeae TaxID=1917180 RepID=A0A398BMN5_9BACI|nr:ribonuclease M5 [Mesobacillus zeae]RID88636.1 ribonuclease M5 [Mesobacillus zeae]